jgi:glucosamine 6-phosphate synthetase-like amidotransferase/phosphosugar isomerase protein
MIYDGDDIVCKTKGKVDLEEKASKEMTSSGTIGIYACWATHGVPNDVNSIHLSNSGI